MPHVHEPVSPPSSRLFDIPCPRSASHFALFLLSAETLHRVRTCRHDKATAFIASKVTHENWNSLSARSDAAEARASACKTWILFANHLAEVCDPASEQYRLDADAPRLPSPLSDARQRT